MKIKLFKKEKDYTIYNGSMLELLEVISPNSIDSIVCDPPYGLNFMNRGWDNCGVSFNVETWKKCYEVLKPGGYLLAFGGTRTFHRIACAIEDAGFEIRDTIMWLYGSGFPKGQNIGLAVDKIRGVESEIVGERGAHDFSKNKGSMMSFTTSETGKQEQRVIEIKEAQNEWKGWNTSLKPAYEPIIMARKPFKGTVVDNVLKYGVGGININECRVVAGDDDDFSRPATPYTRPRHKDKPIVDFNTSKIRGTVADDYLLGRYPANIIHDGNDEVIGGFPDVGNGSASRYFYTAKATVKDRDDGLDTFEIIKITDGSIRSNQETGRKFGGNPVAKRNIHPTVKPTELMQYLVRLVTPSGGTILDPFMGSGSTGKAVMFENRERSKNYKFVGIDLNEEYCNIANARIYYALNKFEYDFLKEGEEKNIKPLIEVKRLF